MNSMVMIHVMNNLVMFICCLEELEYEKSKDILSKNWDGISDITIDGQVILENRVEQGVAQILHTIFPGACWCSMPDPAQKFSNEFSSAI